METAALQVSINTQAARSDLNALAKAFDRVGGAFNSLDREFAASAGNIDKNATKAVKGFDKVARVAALLGKIKIATNSVDAIRQFTTAIDQLGRARSISDAKINNLRKFMVLASAMRAPTGVNGLAQFMQVISTVRVPTAATVKRLQEFFKAIQAFRAPPASGSLAQLFATFGSLKVPTTAQIARLRELLTVLGQAKNVHGAASIARDLDMIAASAGRAGAAINNMPSRMRNLGQSAGAAHQNVQKMSGGIHELNNRLSLGYQLGTAFTAMFSTFTLGAFFREIWKTNIEMAKLEKSMLFATGSMEGQHKAVGQALGMFQQLGMRIDVAADSYARFAISSTAAGFSIDQTQKVFRSIGQALQVVGASGQQIEYAMYGLTQMMQKGKVSSEEFNRQIGEQLPGNAAIGAKALSTLLGRQVSVAEFFDKMAKGQIQSATFAPAWAAEMDKMYAPLRALVDIRPDVALNRLKNAFTLFALEVGKSGFMSGMGRQFGMITGSLIEETEDGSIRLTKAGQDLATRWGGNLAKAVEQVGKVVHFLADNINLVVDAVKGLIALRLTATLAQWGSSAAQMTSQVFAPMGVAVRAASARRAATSPISAAASSAAASSAAAYGPQMTGLLGSTAGIRASRAAGAIPTTTRAAGGMAGRAAAGAASAGTKAMNALGAAAALAGTKVAGAARATVAGGATMARGLFSASTAAGLLGSGMRLLGPIGLAAGVALAMFGDKAIEVGDKTTTSNDLVAAGFGMLTKGISDWWKNSGLALKLFGQEGGNLKSVMGDVVANLVAGFVTLGQVVGNVLLGIGNAVNALLIGPMGSLIAVFNKLLHGDFSGAWDSIKGLGTNSLDSLRAAGGNLMNAGRAVGNFGQTRDQLVTDAAARTAARAQGDAASEKERQSNEALQRDIESQLQRQRAENERLEAEGRQQAAMRAIAAGPAGTLENYETIMSRMTESMNKLRTATDANTQATTNSNSPSAQAMMSAPALTVAMLKQHEGFRSSSYWDVNAFRAGYGSDTITDPTTGRVSRVTRETRGVTQEMAEADLRRRIQTEFMPAARRGIGDSVFNGLSAAAQAALTSVAYNYGSIPNSVRRAAQGGDVNAIANAVAALGSDNGGVNRRRRAEEATAIRSGEVIGAGTGMTQAESESIEAKGLTLRDTYERLVGNNPVRQAQSQYNRFIVDLTQFEDTLKELQGKGMDVSGWMDRSAFDAANAKLQRDMEDAINPLGKMRRDDNRENDLLQARISGARDEAGFVERVQNLREQGYEFESEAGLARLETERNLYEETQRRNRLLQSQLELINAQNEVSVSRIERNGSARDADFARRLMAQAGEGRSYAQALEDARLDGSLSNLQAAAGTAEQERIDAAMQSAQRQIAEMSATARLRGSERARQDNYKSYLEELTGLTGRTTAELEAQSPVLARFARQLADAKTAIENPPGFQRWVDGLTPLADRLEEIKGDFMSGLSSGITDALMGEEVDWSAIAKDITKKLVAARVDASLGALVNNMGARAAARNVASQDGRNVSGPAGVTSDDAKRPGGFWGKVRNIFSPQQHADGTSMDIAERAGRAFGLIEGGERNAFSTTKDAQNATQNMTVTAQTVTLNAQNLSVNGAAQAQGEAPGASAFGSAMSDLTNKLLGKKAPDKAEEAISGAGAQLRDAVAQAEAYLAQPVAANDNAARGGGIGGFFGGLKNGIGKAFGGVGDFVGSMFGGAGDGGDAFAGGLGGLLGGINMVLDLFGIGVKKPEKPHVARPVNGLIGEMGAINMSGTEIAAKSNPFASLATMGLDLLSGGAYSTYAGLGNMLSSTVGRFKEGGYATDPVDWARVPHYREGTANTDGIPAMLHPNEAVIPLSRGRKVPIEGDFGGGDTSVTNNSFTIVANDPNEYRYAQSSIQRKQNRAAQRARLRNLS